MKRLPKRREWYQQWAVPGSGSPLAEWCVAGNTQFDDSTTIAVVQFVRLVQDPKRPRLR